jgi:hypothetical protein
MFLRVVSLKQKSSVHHSLLEQWRRKLYSGVQHSSRAYKNTKERTTLAHNSILAYIYPTCRRHLGVFGVVGIKYGTRSLRGSLPL